MTMILNTFKHLAALILISMSMVVMADVLPAIPIPTPASAGIRFRNSTDVWLRDAKLKNPVGIDEGADITIDPEFLKRNLGTDSPTADQMQRFMLNPGEYSRGKVGAESFRSTNGRRGFDYFFPVTVRSPNHEPRTGKLALQFYSRNGQLEMIRPSDAPAPTAQTNALRRTLIAQNRTPTTQAETCEACRAAALANAPGPTPNMKDIRTAIETSARAPSNTLFSRYQAFARGFTARNGRVTKANAGYMKRKYIKELIDTFGEQEAGSILTALTGFAEAPSRASRVSQVAEISAIMKVIENRARNGYRNSNSRTLRDIGDNNPDPRTAAILQDWQFSAWNDRDNMLTRILNLNPDSGETEANRRVAMAFEAQQMMASGQVEFVGRLNDPRMQHYHANYVYPAWAGQGTRIAAIVKVNGVIVDLSAQRGARHLFYTGVP